MEANVPFPRVQRQVPGCRNLGQDLISSLPDDLICHIFSFLQIKDVLRTSVLSKRWHRCWTQTPGFCIRFEEREDDHEFFNSIENVFIGLESSNLSVNSFHLHLFPVPTGQGMVRLDNYVSFAIKCRVKDLHIELYKLDVDEDTWEFYDLPEFLFDCQTLESLYTRRCNFSGLHENHKTHWDSLRYFTIDTLELFDTDMARVWGHCPVLEHLELQNCFSKEHIRICSGEMRELVIRGYSIADPTQWEFLYEDDGDEEHEEECDNSLRISAPRLESLQLLGTWRSKTMILLRDLSSLNEARLDFKETDEYEHNNVVRYIINRLLRDLCMVTRLFIGRYSLQVLLISRLKQGNQRLQCLYLAIRSLADKKGLQQIAEILEYTPNVKNLVIEFFSVNVHDKWSFIVDPYKWNVKGFEKSEAENLNCLSESLLNVEIIGFGTAHRYGLKYQLLLVRFLLRYSLVLEKMVLHTTKSWVGVNQENLQKLAKIVQGCPRGSEAAKVVLRSPFDGTETVITPQPPSNPFPFKVVPFPLVYVRRRVPKRQQGKPRP